MSEERRLNFVCAWLAFSPTADVLTVSAVTDADTATPGKWAQIDRPVRFSAGVHIRMEVRQYAGRRSRDGECDDNGPDLTGVGWRQRRVPGAD
jgi:hypothetical protein